MGKNFKGESHNNLERSQSYLSGTDFDSVIKLLYFCLREERSLLKQAMERENEKKNAYLTELHGVHKNTGRIITEFLLNT